MNAPQTPQQVEEVLGHGIRIPPQPRVVEEVHQMLFKDDFSVRRMARLISQDAGLTAALFRLVRSGAYAQRRLESLEQVLSVVGVKPAFNLIRAISLQEAFSGDHRVLERFWARSTEIAQLAATIAEERVAVCNIFPDQAYMVGIFHDCGVPVLMERFPEYCSALHLASEEKWVSIKDEDRAFHVDHCVIGYLVARHWGLPDFISDAIRFHHELPRLDNNASRTMVAILLMASEIYCRQRHVVNPDWATVAPLVMEELGIHLSAAEDYIDDVVDLYYARHR